MKDFAKRVLQFLNLYIESERKYTKRYANWKTGNKFDLKGDCVIRDINCFGTENVGYIKNIPPGSSVHSNLYQHQLSLRKR